MTEQMPPIIFLFPGQGAQYPGMGRKLYEAFPQVRALFERAESALDLPVISRILESSRADLEQTSLVQPLVTLVNLACLTLVQEAGLEPAAVAGHSLGEYAALRAATVLTEADLFRLVRLRGQLMQTAANEHAGAMVAISGVETGNVLDWLQTNATDDVVLACYNAPHQTVLSGDREALRSLAQKARELGWRVQLLNVAGAWHSPLMQSVVSPFAEALAQATFANPKVPVYCNYSGSAETQPEVLRRNCREQITSPVRWQQIMLQMCQNYPEATFVELGPGRTLSGLLLLNQPRRKIYNVEDLRSFEHLLKQLDSLKNPAPPI